MKYIKYFISALLFVSVAHCAVTTLNLTGRLYTSVGLITTPMSVSYDASGAVPWIEDGYYIVNPTDGNLTLDLTLRGLNWTQANDIDFPDWPGLVLHDGDAFSLDFMVMEPLVDVWRLGAGGPIENGSVQLFVDLYDGTRFGTADAPIPNGLLPCMVPEPGQYGLVAGLGLLLVAFARRRR